jgi:hypothetical protein
VTWCQTCACGCSFKWFLEPEPRSTNPCAAQTINPKFNYEVDILQVVTEEFVEYVNRDAVEVDVYGSPADEQVKWHGGDAMMRYTVTH